MELIDASTALILGRRLVLALLAVLIIAAASVGAPRDEVPAWLAERIRAIERNEIAEPPEVIYGVEYIGTTTYLFQQSCCDRFSDVFGTDGSLLYKTGGYTGGGDGRCPQYNFLAGDARLVWRPVSQSDRLGAIIWPLILLGGGALGVVAWLRWWRARE